jgi:hypothetical protein
MKSNWPRLIAFASIAGVLLGGTGFFIARSAIGPQFGPRLPPETKATLWRAHALHSYLAGYAVEHEGRFPDEPSALLSDEINIGFPVDQADEFLGPVFDYRGRGHKASDHRELLLFRFRIKDVTDKEVRVTIGGSCRAVPVSDPVPEDPLYPSAR